MTDPEKKNNLHLKTLPSQRYLSCESIMTRGNKTNNKICEVNADCGKSGTGRKPQPGFMTVINNKLLTVINLASSL